MVDEVIAPTTPDLRSGHADARDRDSTPPTARCGSTKPSPTARPRGAVVVIQEAFGVNPHIEDVTRRFAAAGYHAVAPDMFHRTGGAVVDYDDFGSVIEHFVGDRQRRRDPRRRRRHARLPPRRSASPTSRSASSASASAAACRSSSRRNARSAPPSASTAAASSPRASRSSPRSSTARRPSQTPWLGLFGDLDESIPVDDVEQLRAALADGARRHRGRPLRRRRARLPLRRAPVVQRRRRGRRLGRARSTGSRATSARADRVPRWPTPNASPAPSRRSTPATPTTRTS